MSPKLILAVIFVGICVFLMMRYVSDDRTPLQRGVAQELRMHGFDDVDVSALTANQIARIRQLTQGSQGPAEIRNGIKTVLEKAE